MCGLPAKSSRIRRITTRQCASLRDQGRRDLRPRLESSQPSETRLPTVAIKKPPTPTVAHPPTGTSKGLPATRESQTSPIVMSTSSTGKQAKYRDSKTNEFLCMRVTWSSSVSHPGAGPTSRLSISDVPPSPRPLMISDHPDECPFALLVAVHATATPALFTTCRQPFGDGATRVVGRRS